MVIRNLAAFCIGLAVLFWEAWSTANPLIKLEDQASDDLSERSTQPAQQAEVVTIYDPNSDSFSQVQRLVRPALPSFSTQQNTVNYTQTILPKTAYTEGRQQVQYRNPAVNSELTDYANVWTIGDGWLGAKFEYRTWAYTSGNAYAMARLNATVLGKTNDFLRTSVRTTRDRQGTYHRVGDDRLHYEAEAFAFGDTIALEEGDVALGHWRRTPGRRFHRTFFRRTWRYAIGPVPIRIWLRLDGEADTGNPKIDLGTYGGRDVRFNVESEPTAALVAAGGADVFGDVPAAIRPGDAGLHAHVDFLKGRVIARAHGNSTSKAACADVGFREFSVLSGRLTAFAYWQALSIENVTRFVHNICHNSFFQLPGCSETIEVVDQVSSWLNFNYEKVLMERAGFHFGSYRPWLRYSGCLESKPETVVQICNDYPEDIYAVIAYYDHQADALRSKGWYKNVSQTCRQISLGNYQGDTVYLYAEHNLGETTWSGDALDICVDRTSAFDFLPGDESASCSEDRKMVGTDAFSVVPNRTNTWTFRQ